MKVRISGIYDLVLVLIKNWIQVPGSNAKGHLRTEKRVGVVDKGLGGV